MLKLAFLVVQVNFQINQVTLYLLSILQIYRHSCVVKTMFVLISNDTSSIPNLN